MAVCECSRLNILPRTFPLRIFAVVLIGICVFGTIYFATVISKIPLKDLSHNVNKSPDVHTASDYVQVFIPTSRSEIVGTMAAVKSIISNTEHPTHFYFVTSKIGASELHSWIEGSYLKDISYVIKIFEPEAIGVNISSTQNYGNDKDEKWLEYSKFYISSLLPQMKGVLICLSSDVIVQGDIANLRNMTIGQNNFGLFSRDCDAVSRVLHNHKSYYYQLMDVKNEYLEAKKIDGKQCIFSLDVMVLNMSMWSRENVSSQLEYWHRLNEKENIFSTNDILPPFLVVFYNRISQLDSSWHVHNLGMSRGTRYSKAYLTKANLLQWDGHFKPWKHKSAFSSLWTKYVVPKPEKKSS